MKRSHQLKLTKQLKYSELVRQTVFHEAGYATAIYLYNKSNGLPSVFFEIITSGISNQEIRGNKRTSEGSQFIAKINGGRLIQNQFMYENGSRIDLRKNISLLTRPILSIY